MWWLLLLALLIPSSVQAHPLAPVAVAVEQLGQDVTMTVKQSRVTPRGASVSARVPASCRRLSQATHAEDPSTLTQSYRLRCPASLTGESFGVDGLSGAGIDALVVVTLDDGREIRQLLDRSEDQLTIPAKPSWDESAASMFRSGLEHLLGGWDHLLFVVGLVLLVGRPRKVLLALTAFTLGHAIAMTATVLGVVSIPSAAAELAIAITIAWLARQLLRPTSDRDRFGNGYLAAVGVGLVHGLGFATAFTELGVAGVDVGPALAAFHLGIEAGQFAVVLCTLAVLHVCRNFREPVETSTAVVIGSVGLLAVAQGLAALLP